MYEEHFGFSGSPFRLNPDPKFFFGSRSHNKAMAYLHYGLRQGEGFIVISGEIGAGKSMLIGHLLDQLDRSNIVAANLLTTNLEADALLSHILSAFRIEPAGSGKTAEIEAFEDFLFDQLNRGRRVLLIVDEAQNLPIRTIEELRMLSNMDYEGTPLFQVFLVGQPEFRAMLSKPDMEQFRQRVIASYHLEPIGAEETRDYIEHRLSLVGWQHNPHFTPDAFDAVFAATAGVPRKINKLCNRILLHASIEKLATVDREAVGAVVSDLKEENFERRPTVDVEIAPRADPAPPIAMEAVDETAAEVQEPAAAAGGAPVVIPFGAPRKIGAASQSQPPAEIADASKSHQPTHSPEPTPVEAALARVKAQAKKTKEKKSRPHTPIAPTPVAPSSETPVVTVAAAAPVSALDKLRSLRESAKVRSQEPQPATLADVGAAVEAAAVGPLAAQNPAEAAESISEEEELVPDADIKAWRQSIVKSIEETRQELKSAHAIIARLRRHLAEVERGRRERRERIAAGLSKAEEILSEFRNAPR